MATTGTNGGPTPRVIMQALSNATGVPVLGGEVNQRVDTLFNFTGRVLTLVPIPPNPIVPDSHVDPETALSRPLTTEQRVESLRSSARMARTNAERVAAVEGLIRLVGFPEAQRFGRSVGVQLER
jgi:hypothetical protein